jgi:predicted nucleotidyltransferase component of viral defense system
MLTKMWHCEAVQFTAAEIGFVPRLIEKDYFCTVLLDYLSTTAGADLVFKGGTCLTKVHSELYRLSEDLDYTIPVALDAPRPERHRDQRDRAAVECCTGAAAKSECARADRR